MGKSFIEFRGHGFWVRDTPLEVWLTIVTLHLRYGAHLESAAFADLRETWLNTRDCQGCVGNCALLDRVLASDDLVRVAVEASREALASIRRIGPMLDRNYLDLLGFSGFDQDLDAWKVVQVGEHFVSLLNGGLAWNVQTSPVLPSM